MNLTAYESAVGQDTIDAMQAVVQREYGSSDTLRLGEVERPTINADEVLVRVHAAGIDRGTWHLMTGLPYVTRLGFGLRRPRNPVPGLDLAGTVEAVDPGAGLDESSSPPQPTSADPSARPIWPRLAPSSSRTSVSIGAIAATPMPKLK